MKKIKICGVPYKIKLVQLGYNEQSADEIFVQSISNAMYQIFEFKE